jgi:hypothetical protein
MTFKEKRRSKKLATIYMSLAYLMVATFFTLVVLSATRVIDFSNGGNPSIWTVLIGVSPLFIGMFLGMFSGWSVMKRTTYKFKIKKYREYRHFNIILDYLEVGNVVEARKLFDSLPQDYLKVFVNGMIFGYRMLSTDEKTKAFAKDKLNRLREDFCHHNIQF